MAEASSATTNRGTSLRSSWRVGDELYVCCCKRGQEGDIFLWVNIADQPWLGKRGLRNFVVWLTFTSLIGLLGFGFLISRAKGYTHPPLMYGGALLLAAVLVWLGLHMRSKGSTPIYAAVPGYWSLRVQAFFVTVAFFFTSWAMPYLIPWPVVPMLIIVGLVVLGVWQISGWARRPVWDATYQLALVSGVLSFFIMLSPLVEFVVRPADKIVTGQTLFAFSCLVGLILLTLVVKRRGYNNQVLKDSPRCL